MKITFITYHNWETKRQGGFHKFAEAAARAGHEVVFFSFDRPYIIYFKKEERLNKGVLIRLSKGTKYKLENGGAVFNCTWPTLRLPMPFLRYAPNWLNRWLETHSLKPFRAFCHKFLDGTDVFVFESCAGLQLFDSIRNRYPKAKYVYRPSDPLMIEGAKAPTIEMEKNCLLHSDLTLLVNVEGLNLYKKTMPDFDKEVPYKILSNGVDVNEFKQEYPVPAQLAKPNTALYVGARRPEWGLVAEAARQCKDINFVIVCPEFPPMDFPKDTLPNLVYIPGIKPSEVPAWVTNCKVIIIPNPQGLYKVKPWGVTAKYYQAMAAQKPIVVYEDSDEIKQLGIPVSHNYGDFISDLQSAFCGPSKMNYRKLDNKEWKVITNLFLDYLNELK